MKMPDVNCKYGAPMGRFSSTPECSSGTRIRLFRVSINSGGYDNGGAYWGIGRPLYCATDDDFDFQKYLRADNREEAKAELLSRYPNMKFYR